MRILGVVVLGLAVLLGSSTVSADLEYQNDDGFGTISSGGSANDRCWGNVFQVEPPCTMVTELNVAFGFDNASTALVGMDVEWRIFGDNDADPTNGLTLLATGSHVVENNPQTLILDAIPVGAVSVADFDYFFVSMSMNSLVVFFPSVQDNSPPTDGNRSFTIAGIAINPTDWSSANAPPVAGDYLIRATAEAGGIPGDVNCDGVVNLLDVGPFVDAVSNAALDIKADINQDGSDDLLDVGPFVDLISAG